MPMTPKISPRRQCRASLEGNVFSGVCRIQSPAAARAQADGKEETAHEEQAEGD